MLIKYILPYFLLGFALSFLVSRPIQKYKAREYCKQKGLANDLPNLKWYEHQPPAQHNSPFAKPQHELS